MASQDSKLVRIGVFYDGNYFLHVSNYYNYSHPRKARLNIGGLHEFIRYKVAELEDTDDRYCRVVDSHYFRGRLTAYEAQARNKLFPDRLFDDILMREGVVTHYLPISNTGEKGIDVWLALEAYELAHLKQYNVLVLVACDGDYVPLVRKLNALGTRVLVMGWDFEYTDDNGNLRTTTTSVSLLREATHPVQMHAIIDDKTQRNSGMIDNLFVSKEAPRPPRIDHLGGGRHVGNIVNLKNGYGFIAADGVDGNLYFYWGDLVDSNFHELYPGAAVEFSLGQNDKGPCAIEIRMADPAPVV